MARARLRDFREQRGCKEATDGAAGIQQRQRQRAPAQEPAHDTDLRSDETTEGDARGLVDGQLRIEGIKFAGLGDGFGVTFWGKNITNKSYVTRSVDFGQLGFAGVIYGDPQTYGLTIDFGF